MTSIKSLFLIAAVLALIPLTSHAQFYAAHNGGCYASSDGVRTYGYRLADSPCFVRYARNGLNHCKMFDRNNNEYGVRVNDEKCKSGNTEQQSQASSPATCGENWCEGDGAAQSSAPAVEITSGARIPLIIPIATEYYINIPDHISHRSHIYKAVQDMAADYACRQALTNCTKQFSSSGKTCHADYRNVTQIATSGTGSATQVYQSTMRCLAVAL